MNWRNWFRRRKTFVGSVEVKFEYPPNIKEISAVLPESKRSGVLFSWGEDRIYNPSRVSLSSEILAHERIHGQRQGVSDVSIRQWWYQYLKDPDFRFMEELLSHREEYRVYQIYHPDEDPYPYLCQLAERLSSPLYGTIVDYKTVRSQIRSASLPRVVGGQRSTR